MSTQSSAVAQQGVTEQDGLPEHERRWAIVSVAIGVGMASLDTAIANTALPAMAMQLNSTPADSVWIVNIYQLAMVATLLPSLHWVRYLVIVALRFLVCSCLQPLRWLVLMRGRCRHW